MSNQPNDTVSVLLTEDQLKFLIRNCEKNIDYARQQLLAWSTLSGEELEGVRESFIKLNDLKCEFEALRKTLLGAV